MTWSGRLNPALVVTVTRMALAVPFMICFFLPGAWPVWGAGLIFLLAGISDALDGWLARRLDLVTDLGAILDPIADKVINAVALIMLAADGRVPAVAAALLLSRDFLVSGLRQAERSRQVLSVSTVAKWKTAAQFAAIGILLFAPAVPDVGALDKLGIGLLWIAVILSLWTGTIYGFKAMKAL